MIEMESKQELENRILDVLYTIYDPEIPVNIYELGLIYEVKIDDAHHVHIKMTLTSPNCPAAELLPPEIEEKIKHIEGVQSVRVEVVWEPVWTPDRMSEAAKLELGLG
jgi:FeS assembly SUF system protein